MRNHIGLIALSLLAASVAGCASEPQTKNAASDDPFQPLEENITGLGTACTWDSASGKLTVTVDDGFDTASDSVTITATNATPVADAGADHTVAAGASVTAPRSAPLPDVVSETVRVAYLHKDPRTGGRRGPASSPWRTRRDAARHDGRTS